MLSANLDSNEKIKLNCVRICKNEAKLNLDGKNASFMTFIFAKRSLFA